MVLCKYFMNGNCRFGTKCVNEHLDVKQLLKSDVESAVNGNQWPLSCFGPFKEKPSVPNFIEDQSFEEIRMLCYGSKKQNFFEQFNQQFSKEVMEAKNKMKMLLTLNKEVMDVVVNLYNTTETPKNTTQPNSNPFATANPQQMTNNSLFGTPSATTQNYIFASASAGTPFGASNNASSGGGIFGGAQQKPLLGQSAFGSFGGQTQLQQPTAGLFSSPQTQPQQTNAFGSNIFAQASQQQTPVGGGSIFGGVAQQQQPQTQLAQSQQPFGAANSSVFGQQPNAGGGIFAQAAQQTQAQPQHAAISGNIFAQAAQPQQQTAFGMFSQTPQQQQQQPPPPFGAQMTQQSPFGGAQPQQQGAFFGQMQQQQQQQQQQQLQMPQAQPNTGNIFSTQMQQPQQQFAQQQQQSGGLFASAAVSSPFGAPQQQQQQQQANIFAQAAAGYPQPQQQQQQYHIQPAMVGDRTYSKMENLTAEEIEAFKAETFELGKIPFSPPPRELVN